MGENLLQLRVHNSSKFPAVSCRKRWKMIFASTFLFLLQAIIFIISNYPTVVHCIKCFVLFLEASWQKHLAMHTMFQNKRLITIIHFLLWMIIFMILFISSMTGIWNMDLNMVLNSWKWTAVNPATECKRHKCTN